MAAVVIDRETTAHVEEPHRGTESRQFHINLPGFLKRVLEHGDVVDLTADVEMEQPQIL